MIRSLVICPSVVVTLFWFSPLLVVADDSGLRPTVLVKPRVIVNSDTMTLGDIAEISSTDEKAKPLVEQLKQLPLGDAPPPRATTTILGEAVLSTIQQAGIKPETIGYSLPRVITVEREGRLISQAEVIEAIRATFRKDDKSELQVKQVEYKPLYAIPAGPTKIHVDQIGKPAGGKLPLRIEVFVNNQSAARFLASATVDYWQDVPVLTRTLERGMLISPNDMQMVRVNVNQYPDDIVANPQDAVGRRAKSRLSAGEAIRQSLVDIPPVIPRGQRVTMLYQNSGIKATASAVAMEDGFNGGSILVQNDSSKKVLRAHVVNTEIVEIRAE